MNTNLLFSNFDLLNSPEKIQKFKQSVLQLAVQGKLVPQDPNDVPASVLLKKIGVKKKELIKEGIIKKEKPLPAISEDEPPYCLPEGWVWTRIGNIYHDLGQKKPDKKFTYIDVSSINKEKGIIGENLQIIEAHDAPSRARKIVKKDVVIYSTVRPYLLNIAIIDKDFTLEPIVSTAFSVIKPLNGINNKYVYTYLKSKPFIDYVESTMLGMAYPAINDRQFKSGLIAIPPSNEQMSIVNKVDELFKKADEIEKQLKKADEDIVLLNKSALNMLNNSKGNGEFKKSSNFIFDNFDLLYSDERNVEELKQTILQLAVQGKLVPQNPNDEPASVLLEKIKAEKDILIKSEKIKKEKVLPQITVDEIPYQLPKGWEWAKLGHIAIRIHYGYTASADSTIKEIKLLRITDIQNSKVNWETVPGCIIEKQDIPKYLINENDILIARTGGTIGKSFLVKNVNVKSVFASYLIRIIPSTYFNPKYLKIFFDSPLYWEQLIEKSMGTGQPNVNGVSLSNLIVPIPSLNQQKRIVEKVDELLKLCDELESKITQSKEQSDKLVDAILNEAFQ